MKKITLFLLVCILCISSANAQRTGSQKRRDNISYYISCGMSIDSVIQKAKPYFGKFRLEFIFKDGIHYLAHPITLTSFCSGTHKYPVLFRSEHPGKAIISGGMKLSLMWRHYKGNIYCADVPSSINSIDQLYINGKRMQMARYPNVIRGKNIYDTWNLGEKNACRDNCLDSTRISLWKDPTGGYLHAMHEALWGDMHWLIKGKNKSGCLELEGGWQNNRPAAMHPVYKYVENIFEELDAPEEWYFNPSTHQLYYYVSDVPSLARSEVEVVLLANLFTLRGSQSLPLRYVEMSGLRFQHTSRTFMENKEPLLRSDWTIYRGGALMYEATENCLISNCDFELLGGNAVFVSNYNRCLMIKGCYITESGANGIAFVGNPLAVRSPLFRYGEQNYSAIDRTIGSINNDYPIDCKVEDCLITRTGRYEKQTAPIQISMSKCITVSHCSIYNVPRAGININEGTFGGHIIEYCDVFNTVLETGDHGSFNSWGRDRYWTPSCRITEQEVAKDPILPHLDMLEPNIIRNSRWRCDHGWDIDLDDGSSFYRIYNNVLLNGGLKLREGYGRVVYNNIVINNSLHPHVWYYNCGDTVRNNIFFDSYKPIGIESKKWGNLIDYNYFIKATDRNKYQVMGCDRHSLWGDPLFVDPSVGNYQVKPLSKALSVGFKNFPMDFGVVSPRLKKMAAKPLLPLLNYKMDDASESATYQWQGLLLKKIETDGEQSAVGRKDKCGLLVIAVGDHSIWKDIVQINDAIMGYGSYNICSFDELISAEKHSTKKEISLWREQHIIKVKK